jgi:dTDP-4-amino-4,6-dideoxygalactose transaminase
MLSDWPHEFPGAYWLDEEEDAAVLDVLHKRSLFRHYGIERPTHVKRFEAAARDFYGVRNALAVNSGTGALDTALLAFGIGPGDEVIIPSLMWIATISAVVHHNAIPVICEVDDSFTLDPIDLERKITPRTKLILPVHMAGAPTDMDAVMRIAAAHGIKVLEDVAQCNGGTFGGRKLGTFGDIGIFSLQTNKNITAGEGGLVVTNDDDLFLKALTGHDMGLVFTEEGAGEYPPDAGIVWPNGRRMAELLGAVANVQITKLPRIIEHMRGSKSRIRALLADVPGLSFRRITDPGGDTGPFMIMLLDNAEQAIRATDRLKSRGLHNCFRLEDYGHHIYYNIRALVEKVPLSPAGNPWSLAENAGSVHDYAKGACPRSDDLFARSILVPVPSRLTSAQEEDAAAVIRESLSVPD